MNGSLYTCLCSRAGHILRISVFHNYATVKWDSIIKKFFWLSENGDLTCGNITKVPKLGKINFMKLISCEI